MSIRVGFLSAHNYFNRNSWSGTIYNMYQNLKSQNVKLIDLGNPIKASVWRTIMSKMAKLEYKPPVASEDYIKKYQNFAYNVNEQLKKNPCDVIFACVASQEIYFLETNIPVLYSSDTTFRLYDGYYRSDFSKKEWEWRETVESIAINKAHTLVYPSQWAAQSAINDYQADVNKIKIIPYGANLDNPPKREEVLQRRKSLSPCRLLFIGRNWQRKGGDIAVETLKILNNRNIDTELVMIGSVPPSPIDDPKLKIIPFLDKNSSQQRRKFEQLFWESNFLLFPTRADCSPISICEANAFGLPVISSNVGGIPDIITEGKNGYLMDVSATAEDYANSIQQLIDNPDDYEELMINARNEYETLLNWDVWAKEIYSIMEDTLK